MYEESSVTQSSQAARESNRERRLPGREEFEDWLKEIRTFSQEVLEELRGAAVGEEIVESRGHESLDDGGNSEHRLAALKQRLTQRLQETSDGGEMPPAHETDDWHPAVERSLES